MSARAPHCLRRLRGVTPTLDESDITRERLALEKSIRKVEAEAARKFADGKRPPPPRIRPIEPRAAPDVEEPSMPAPRRSVKHFGGATRGLATAAAAFARSGASNASFAHSIQIAGTGTAA